jgi:hypothetical protein
VVQVGLVEERVVMALLMLEDLHNLDTGTRVEPDTPLVMATPEVAEELVQQDRTHRGRNILEMVAMGLPTQSLGQQ